MIETLQHVSDQWLDGRNEMHFSVGQFSEAYLSKAPIGIMRNEEGKNHCVLYTHANIL